MENIELISALIAAASLKGVGRKAIFDFIKMCGACGISRGDVQKRFCASQQMWDEAVSKSLKIVDVCVANDIDAFVYGADEYPLPLAMIDDPPYILYVKGDASALCNQNAVAVIGSRAPIGYSSAASYKLGMHFAREGFAVVSGLALGCDTEAHRGALDGSGQTVAVLAHGLDMIYPAKNKCLASSIVAGGGCLVSEYPPGVKPFKSFFVQRDRIQSGLSKATVVVQTKIGGGSMHTSGFCVKQGRRLACVAPFEKNHDLFSGNVDLLERGSATIINTPESLSSFTEQLRSFSYNTMLDRRKKTSDHLRLDGV